MPHKNPAAKRAYNHKYYHEGPGRQQHQAYQLELKLATFNAYGGCKCARCGFADHRGLNLDHIAGGGTIDRITSPSRTIYLKLKRLNYPPGFQVLCANCNSIKKYENNEFKGPRGWKH